MRRPDHTIWTPEEAARLCFVAWSLRRGYLSYSEWCIRTPDGRRIRVGFDRRYGPPTPQEVGGRP